MATRVLVLHGPNVSFALPGGRTLEQLDRQLATRASALGLEVRTFQANGESALLDELLRQRAWAQAVVVNPGSLAPVAYGLADALTALKLPAVEVLLDHALKGRGSSALQVVVTKQLHGKGEEGYLRALESLAGTSPRKGGTTGRAKAVARNDKTIGGGRGVSTSARTLGSDAARRKDKTIGKRSAPEAVQPQRPSKSIGRRAAAQALRESDGPMLSPPSFSNGLSRAGVRAKVADRLAGKVSAEALAAWARAQWLVVTSGGAVENGHGDTLEQVLLSIASPKATDDALLAAMAKLEA